MKKLYKTDSKGKLRVWYAEAIGGDLHVSHGLNDGKAILDITPCTPKNVGKKSETTPAQQATKECAALYIKKVERNGYSESKVSNTSPTVYPMLARDYSKLARQLNDCTHVWLSRKLDGVRAIWRPDVKKFQSRTGVFYSVPHLERLLKDVEHNLDGELYIHGTPLNQIVSAARKMNPLTSKITFEVFDVVRPQPFAIRQTLYQAAVRQINDERVVAVPQALHPCSKDEIQRHHDIFVRAGYEGVMIRRDDSTGYEHVRSKTIYKYKEFLEHEFVIESIKPDKRGQAVLKCKAKPVTDIVDAIIKGFDNTMAFDVRCRGSNEDREYQLANPSEFIGKLLTVRYFAITEYGLPTFPIGVTIRDYE